MSDPLAQWEAANQVVGPHAAVSALKQAGAALAEAFQQARTLYLETLRRAVKAEIENKRLRAALEKARSRFSEMEGIAFRAEETEPSWVWGLARKAYIEAHEALAEIEKEVGR